jgi:hypothetical protein
MNVYHPPVVVVPTLYAPTSQAFTNAHVRKDMLWKKVTTNVLVCKNKELISACL